MNLSFKFKKCVIAIPVHKTILDEFEVISLKKCVSVFGLSDVYIVAPLSLDISNYQIATPGIKVCRVPDTSMSSLKKYNNLKISDLFYDLFPSYNFLLTYELDAYVFSNELTYWCKKKYYFIGAVWFEGFDKYESSKIIGGFNSGFSLRNIQMCKKVLRNLRLISVLEKYRKVNILYLLIHFYKIVNDLRKGINSNISISENLFVQEDLFWNLNAPLRLNSFRFDNNVINAIYNLFFKIKFNFPTIEDAIKFSFDVNPSYLFELNGQKLPFGCHGWLKYDFKFWSEFIEIEQIS